MKFLPLVVLCCISLTIAKSPSIKDLAKEIKKLTKDLKNAKKDIKGNESDIKDNKKDMIKKADKNDLHGLEDSMDSIEENVWSLENKYEDHEQRLHSVENSIEDLQDQVARTIVEIAGENLITDDDLQGTPTEIIGKIAQKVHFTSVEPKGTPFKPINGPNGNGTRIGIVGGGVGGVHMAYLLKKKGFSNVTILEKTNRVGGQVDSVTIRGTKMTWHFWNNDYSTTLLPLLIEFGFQSDMINVSRDFMKIWATNDYSMPILERSQFVLSQVMQEYQIQDPNVAYSLVLKQCAEYINIYRKIFGKPEGKLMRRPEPLYMPLISGSIMDFVDTFNLHALLPFFRTMFNLFGTGTMTTMPAIYLFIFIGPELFIEVISAGPVGNLDNRSIDELFPLLIEDQNITTVFDFEVTFIEKLDSGEYKLYSQNGESEVFDFLIWAGLPSDLSQLLYPCDMKNYLFELFDAQETNYANYVSLSMKNSVRGSPVQIYAQQLNSDEFENGIFMDADVYAFAKKIPIDDYINNNFTYNDGSSADVKTFWSLQYCYCEPSEAESIQKVMDHYKGFNGTDITVDAIRTWDKYYPRWSIESAAEGRQWDLYEFQGTENLWIVGAGASFGNIHAIMEYNQLLVSNMI